MKVEIVPVWKQVTPELAQELMAFWQANQAIVEPAAAASRALGVDEAQLRDIREQQMALKTLGLFPTKQSA